jgi:hypothetical protein
MSGSTDNEWWWMIPIMLVIVIVTLILGATGVIGPMYEECEEYGTVLVTVDGDQRCVPWEQAPDLQDFPQP